MTSLATRLKAEIARDGPMPVAAFMARCLTDPASGYYTRQPALGAEGDFITAPEISQIFGELIGIWVLATWQSLGAPGRLRLVELGPGRGTMMRDVLRVFAGARGRNMAPETLSVVLVELDGAMRARQAATLGDADPAPRWIDDLDALRPEAPGLTLVLANEFFDALPVAQYVFADGQWCQRVVVVNAHGALAYGVGPAVEKADAPRVLQESSAEASGVAEGTVFETRHSVLPAPSGPIAAFARLADQGPAAMLVIDYGDTISGNARTNARTGDTLQAVASHRFADVFEAPGTHDLSAHVDFAALSNAFNEAGAPTSPTLTQAEFLAALGLEARLATLMSGKDAPTANQLQVDAARLVATPGMGDRFHVLCARSPDIEALYPFA
ncbi:MAG: SAM-dependent methyltransferase [Pseudomonadota bacterium]